MHKWRGPAGITPQAWAHRVSHHTWNHLLVYSGEVVLLAAQVGLPRRGIPNLSGGSVAHHDHVAIQTRVLAQGRRHRDPPLTVGDLIELVSIRLEEQRHVA